MGYSYSEQEESIVCSSHQADHWGAFMGIFVTRGHDTDTAIRGSQLESDTKMIPAIISFRPPDHCLTKNRSCWKKSLFLKFCEGTSLLIGCIYNQGIVNKIIPSFEDPSNATQMCCISCILLQSLLYGVLWRIQWRQRVLMSPMCYK